MTVKVYRDERFHRDTGFERFMGGEDEVSMSLMGWVMLGYDLGLRNYSRVFYVSFTLNHPQLQLGRTGPPTRTC